MSSSASSSESARPRAKAKGLYLSAEDLTAFDSYKYNSIDNSPLSIYVMKPFWNFTVQFIPTWVAPNVLTFVGFLCILANTVTTSYYDPDFTATYFPAWVWLAGAVLQFVGHQLDGLDGIQARRTGMSSPTGELFDHGLDSLVCSLQCVAVSSAGGDMTAYCALLCQFAVTVSFFFSHLEKYNVGQMFLPWSYDVSQLGIAALFLVTGIYGEQFWNAEVALPALLQPALQPLMQLLEHYLTHPLLLRDVMVAGCILGAVCAVPSATWRMRAAFAAGKDKHGFWVGMQPLFYLCALFAGIYYWATTSPVFATHPKEFMYLHMVLFSHLICRLIISGMTGLKSRYNHLLLLPLFGCIALSHFGLAHDLVMLRGYLIVAVVAHIHFGLHVVDEMSTNFDIFVWSTAKKPRIGASTKSS